MHRLCIISRQSERYRQLIENAALPELVLTDNPAEATLVLADPPRLASRLEEFSNLHWVQSTYAGIDALTQPGLRKDYILTNIRGIFGQLISEYVLGLLISHQRHVAQYNAQQQQEIWQQHHYNSLSGKTMVILGTGTIGQHLAHSAKALGMTIHGVNRSGEVPNDNFDQVTPIDRLTDALSQADIVVSILPATHQTDDLLNAESLNHCRDVLLFNVGRGNAVCEPGLIQALDSGAVAHAFLDVFKQEPLPAAHPFWQHPRITVTPHIAAESFPEQVMEIFKTNYLRYVEGKPLQFQIDFERGY
ncbi:D-2-hydroxyacid dehydrogenase [Photobacterium galatheae]|uniref:2-ketoacid reductase n=1 Tax=Photobacterium galatheae TaxID=1654360 RepID=A0A066RS82_9GAMM|nr:D-2-hydroxyacid dehydrogenase [Photobacterium galatheae]KDM91986.1 2-ketoacid reductase [Photobacterium galatheae]MCM0151282.1 D-2-hydroxyacid dehydrogenase [Photobacterium galatheae]